MGGIFSLVVVSGFSYLIWKVFMKGGRRIIAMPKVGDTVSVGFGHFNPKTPLDAGLDSMRVRVTELDGSIIHGQRIDGRGTERVVFSASDIVGGVSSIQF